MKMAAAPYGVSLELNVRVRAVDSPFCADRFKASQQFKSLSWKRCCAADLVLSRFTPRSIACQLQKHQHRFGVLVVWAANYSELQKNERERLPAQFCFLFCGFAAAELRPDFSGGVNACAHSDRPPRVPYTTGGKFPDSFIREGVGVNRTVSPHTW
jgi:hypothetical protein